MFTSMNVHFDFEHDFVDFLATAPWSLSSLEELSLANVLLSPFLKLDGVILDLTAFVFCAGCHFCT